MALPSNVTYGTVAGRFLIATADTPDDPDRDPQGIPASDLKITFSPDLGRAVARDPSATPPTFFALADVPATIGADGTLLGPDGQPGVRLVASTNPLLEPTGWTWAVNMSGTGYPNIGFSFLLDGGQTLDLGTVLQVPSNPGASLGNWIQAVTDARAARDAAIAAAASVPTPAQLAATYSTLGQLAASPDLLAVGTITRSATGAATSFPVVWPDGSTGTFTGTESTTTPGAIDSYTITKTKSGTTATFTQPALTRDSTGSVTNRPAMTVS